MSNNPKDAFKNEIEKILLSTQDEIKNQFTKQIQQQIVNSLSYNIRDLTSPIVKEFFEKEIQPEIMKILISKKTEILGELTTSIISIASEVGTKLHEQAIKNLSQSWNMSKLVESIFK